jgi:hypothetical protein
MFALTRLSKFPLAAALTMSVALPGISWAIPADSHYMVSPSSCQPATSALTGQSAATSASKLELINGVWTFRSGQTGYAELSCPINFSGGAGEWSLVQLWYRDAFAAAGSSNGYVQGDLMRRERQGAGATQLVWTASSYGNGTEYGFDTNESLPAGPNDFEMYYLRVRLYRATSNGAVAFTGFEIRFQ